MSANDLLEWLTTTEVDEVACLKLIADFDNAQSCKIGAEGLVAARRKFDEQLFVSKVADDCKDSFRHVVGCSSFQLPPGVEFAEVVGALKALH